MLIGLDDSIFTAGGSVFSAADGLNATATAEALSIIEEEVCRAKITCSKNGVVTKSYTPAL